MSKSPAKILIVDDNPDNVNLLRVHLQKNGFDTVAAYDGEEAISAVRNHDPDLILLDLMIPKMDGFEVCRRLKAEYTKTFLPIILLSAVSDWQSKITGLDAGADEYLTKPFNLNEVLARVRAMLRIRRLQKKSHDK